MQGSAPLLTYIHAIQNIIWGYRERGREGGEDGSGGGRDRGREGGMDRREGGREGDELELRKLTKVDLGISIMVKKTLKSSHQTVSVEMSHTSVPRGKSTIRSSLPVYLLPCLNAPVSSPL